ncbi:MAG: Gfo/Idh/MocA family protein [Planctomycetota bacterium]|jgi:predicted dehydrogenase
MKSNSTAGIASAAAVGRRSFLKASAAALPLPCFVPRGALAAAGGAAASERVHIGVIGAGIRGKYLIANMSAEGRVVAVCDCSLPRVADTFEAKGRYRELLARFREGDARHCKAYQDYRKMLDDEKLDAVMIATPDHHHVLAAILACQAGLDVYVEKALSLVIAEGRALVRAVKRYGRVCQVGSQNRSIPLNRYGCQLIRTGGIGRVSLVELANYPGPMRYGGLPAEPVPKGLDWDLFCGPAPMRPHNRRLWVKDEFKVNGQLWRGWDLWRSYSGHLMTNWGAHSADVAQLALGADQSGPVEVWPMLDEYKGPLRLCPVAARYENGVEVRFTQTHEAKSPWVFHGQRGKVTMSRNMLRAEPAELAADAPPPLRVGPDWQGNSTDVRPHVQNWIDSIKGRATPNAPVEVGHRSVTVCHLANIARELGRKIRWDPQTETFPDDDAANALRDRPRRKGYELPEIG